MSLTVKWSLLSCLAVGALMSLGSVQARADDGTAAEIRALKAELRALEAKVNAQAKKQQQTQHEVAAVAAKSGPPYAYTKGPLPSLALICPGGGISFKGICITPGGYFELTNIFRDHNLESDNATPWNSIPYANNKVGHTSEDRFSARGSRLSLLAQGKVNEATTLTGYGEFDFQGAAQTANSNMSDSYQPRIRQLYGALDTTDFGGVHVLFGQSWSLMTMNSQGIQRDKVNAPTTIDQQYSPGFLYARQPQLRITKDITPDFAVALSAENPATTFSGSVPSTTLGTIVARSSNLCGLTGPTQPGGSGGTSGDQYYNSCNTLSINQIPDVIGKAAWDPQFAGHNVHIEGWGVARDFYDRTEAGTLFDTGNHDVWGGGAGGSVLVQLWPKIVDVRFSGAYGNIGRYTASQLPDATFSVTDGTLRPINYTSLLGGVTVHATPTLDIYGYGGTDIAQAKHQGGTAGIASGVGYGNPYSINIGCLSEFSASPCIGDTKQIWQGTVGFWDTVYEGQYGRLQAGAQYSYTYRQSFPGANTTTVGGSTVAAATAGTVPAHASENVFMTSLRYYPF